MGVIVGVVMREEKGERETEEELAGDHPRRPERIMTDMGRCSRCGRQGWLEEMHRPMCRSAWEEFR